MTQIDAFLDDLDRLAAAAPADSADEFYRQLLPTSALAIGAGAAEFVRVDGHAGTTERWSNQPNLPPELLEAERRDRIVADRVPRITTGTGGLPMVACPVEDADTVVGVLAFLLDNSSVGAERSLEVAAAVAETASRYELRRQGIRVSSAEARLTQIEEAIVRLHAHSNQKSMAREAAEQGRRLTGCDRLSVLTRSGRRWRLVAVSGVSRVSRRSDAARSIESVVQTAMRWGEPLRVPFPADPTPPPQVVAVADQHCDSTGVRSLRVVPCEAPEEADGPSSTAQAAILAEWFDEAHDPNADPLLTAIAKHVGVAATRGSHSGTANALIKRSIASLALISLVISAAIASLLIKTSLWVTVDGHFEPVEQARVFAPLDGVVEQVFVSQSEKVHAGQTLIQIASPDLQIKLEEVEEAIAATKAELAALKTAKLRSALPGREPDSLDATTLASRMATQKEKLGHQQRRRDLLQTQQRQLVVKSPISGTIVSWRPSDLLADRPVQRGQRLLEVANEQSWQLELEAPDHRSGYVLEAAKQSQTLRVAYVVRSDPATTHYGNVTEIADTTTTNAEGLPVVRIVVTPEKAMLANPRSGLGVSAKIDCGQYSLAYTWLHEAIDAIRRRWF